MASRKRSVEEQIGSGFLIAGELLGGAAVFLLAVVGIHGIVNAPPVSPSIGPLIAWLELLIATTVMFVTAERWGGFIPGFFFIQGALRATAASIVPVDGATRLEAALIAIYSITIIAVLWRFLPPRRWRATLLDRAALTTFALSVAAVFAAPSTSVALRLVLVGSAPLFVAWTVYRLKIRKSVRKKRGQHPRNAGSELSNGRETGGIT